MRQIQATIDRIDTWLPELDETHIASEMAMGECSRCHRWIRWVTVVSPHLCEQCLIIVTPTRFIPSRDLRDFDAEYRRCVASGSDLP